MSIRVGVRSSLANEATSLSRKSRLLEAVTDFFYGGDFEETSREWRLRAGALQVFDVIFSAALEWKQCERALSCQTQRRD